MLMHFTLRKTNRERRPMFHLVAKMIFVSINNANNTTKQKGTVHFQSFGPHGGEYADSALNMDKTCYSQTLASTAAKSTWRQHPEHHHVACAPHGSDGVQTWRSLLMFRRNYRLLLQS